MSSYTIIDVDTHVTETPERGFPAASSTLAERGDGSDVPGSPA
jgi:hypothetical protein